MTTTEPGPNWSDRLNPRNWSLAWKLIAIGLVPALLALGLGVLRIADQADDAAALGESNQLLRIRAQVAATAVAMRQERDEAALFVAAGRTTNRGVLDVGVSQTDQAATSALGTLNQVELDVTTSAARDQARAAIDSLDALRSEVGAEAGATGITDTDAVIDRYSSVITRIDGLDRALLRQLEADDVAGLADALSAVVSASEQLAIQHTLLGAAIRQGEMTPEDIAEATAADNRLQAEYSTYEVALTPEQLQQFGRFDGVEANAERTRVFNLLVNSPQEQLVTIEPSLWDAAYSTSLNAVLSAGQEISTELASVSTTAEQTASNLAGINSVVLMLGLLIGITIAVLVARALVRSLRVLRTSALDVAEHRLPQAVESMRAGRAPDVTVDPVPLTSRDEVGQVARAFDAVHGQAVRLAAEQAALQANVSSMFVNLSRRSQALVERQLQLIESLESSEQDADQLANLFQLDHLATRMRRNSENLLVLAGTEVAKRNVAPVPMVDVLRAAVSEIEQYQRIVVQTPPTVSIAGRAASDIVHLLAELLDNATNFSPPDSQVVMSTTRTGDGSVLIEIADRGVGMVEHELADANTRLAGPMVVDVSASRRMGLFVIGRLGARHSIQVQLSASSSGGPGSGLTASVTVPAALVPAASQPMGLPRAGETSPQRVAAGGSGLTGGSSGATAGGATAYGSPGSNGNGPRPASSPAGLSAFVAGNDGPASGSLFDSGEKDAPGGSPSVDHRPNGSSRGGLPRRPRPTPGSDGPTPPADGPRSSDRPGERPERLSPAEQARRDQEDAERRATERREAQRRQTDRPGTDPGTSESRTTAQPPARTDRSAPQNGGGANATPTGAFPPVPQNGRPGAGQRPEGSDRPTGTDPVKPAGSTPAGLPQRRPAAAFDSPETSRPATDAKDSATADASGASELPQRKPRTPGDSADTTGTTGTTGGTDRGNPRADVQDTVATQTPFAPPTTPMPSVRTPGSGTGRTADRNGTTEQGTAGKNTDKGSTGPGSTPAGGIETASASAGTDTSRTDKGSKPADAASSGPTLGPISALPSRIPVTGRTTDRTPADRTTDTPAAAPEQESSSASPGLALPKRRPGSTNAARSQNASSAGGAALFGDSRPSSGRPSTIRQQGPAAQAAQQGSTATPQSPAQPPAPQPGASPQQSPDTQGQPQGLAQQPEPTTGSGQTGTSRPQQPGRQAAGAPAAGRETPPARPAQPGADALFGSGTPSQAPAGFGNSPRPAGSGFELGETTPIFEEIASAWFRSNRPLPVDVEAQQPPAPAPAPAPAQAPTPAAAPAPAPRPRPTPTVRPLQQAEPVRSAPTSETFATAADAGWREAADKAATAPEKADDVTAAGLPKRRPRARLVPGSAGSAVLAPPVSPARSAESVRGRLASYQQGVRQGRETRLRGDVGRADASPATGSTDSANAGGHQDEETP